METQAGVLRVGTGGGVGSSLGSPVRTRPLVAALSRGVIFSDQNGLGPGRAGAGAGAGAHSGSGVVQFANSRRADAFTMSP